MLSNIVAAIIFLGISSPAVVLAQDEPKGPPLAAAYKAESITDDVYVIHGPVADPGVDNQGFMNNPAFVLTDAGVVVIDPGSSVQTGEMVVSKIREITQHPVVAAFYSHIHGDHWLGNQAIREAWPDAKLYAHPNLISGVEAGEGNAWLDLMLRVTEGATRGTTVVAAESPVNDGDRITVGNKTFAIHHTGKAHTTSDIMIEVVEDDVLFLGDNAMNQRLGRMDDGNFKGLMTALNKAIELDSRHYVPGHGPSGGREVPEMFLRLITTLYDAVAKEYQNDLADFEMKPVVVEQLGPWSEWQGFEHVGKFISLAYIEVEEDAF
jgi:glyoxylase-like metal-dependent hydrolase (beta-lactamase superfamily II)